MQHLAQEFNQGHLHSKFSVQPGSHETFKNNKKFLAKQNKPKNFSIKLFYELRFFLFAFIFATFVIR